MWGVPFCLRVSFLVYRVGIPDINYRDVGILAQVEVRKTVLVLYTDWHRNSNWSRVVNNIGQACRCRCGPLVTRVGLYHGGWSPEERRREMTNIIANHRYYGAASRFYTYASDDVHDVDVTRWASRGVPKTVPLDSCTPRAMPSKACCVIGVCLYRGSAL